MINPGTDVLPQIQALFLSENVDSFSSCVLVSVIAGFIFAVANMIDRRRNNENLLGGLRTGALMFLLVFGGSVMMRQSEKRSALHDARVLDGIVSHGDPIVSWACGGTGKSDTPCHRAGFEQLNDPVRVALRHIPSEAYFLFGNNLEREPGVGDVVISLGMAIKADQILKASGSRISLAGQMAGIPRT
jgi:hypothetical protein